MMHLTTAEVKLLFLQVDFMAKPRLSMLVVRGLQALLRGTVPQTLDERRAVQWLSEMTEFKLNRPQVRRRRVSRRTRKAQS